jgi:KEOPS complex subunit Cgi121
MIKFLKEVDKYVGIIGLRVNIDDPHSFLEKLKQLKVEAQALNADLVAGEEHLFVASLCALKAFKDGFNISQNVPVETLLYASGQRQIRKAIDMLGVKPGTSHVALVLVANHPDEIERSVENVLNSTGGVRDDSVLMVTEEKIDALRKVFEISNQEFESKRGIALERAIKELIVERSSLLVTRWKG